MSRMSAGGAQSAVFLHRNCSIRAHGSSPLDSRRRGLGTERNTMAPIVFLIGNTMGWWAIVFRSQTRSAAIYFGSPWAQGLGPRAQGPGPRTQGPGPRAEGRGPWAVRGAVPWYQGRNLHMLACRRRPSEGTQL